MNFDEIKGKVTNLQGRIREQWGKLSDDEVAEAKGNREQILGLIQEKYGIAREEAERQFDEWAAKL